MSQFIRRVLITSLAMFVMISPFAVYAQDELLGAGATFPYPFYSKMFDVYNKQYGIKVNYQSIGSGGGIRQLESKTVDFGASDAFMSDKKVQSMKSEVVHIPTC
ncbi:MAG: substrate-binding domain-containing protein, partial [Fibrobacterota bacterium]